MSSFEPAPNPERLIEGELGPLLEGANREFASNVNQAAAFQRVTERLSTSRMLGQRRSYWLIPATLSLLAGVVTVSTVLRRMRSDNAPSVVAEDLHGFRIKPAVAPSTTAAAHAPTEPTMRRRAPEPSALGAKLGAQRASTPVPSNSENHLVARNVAQTAESAAARAPEPALPEPANPTAASISNSAAPDCLSLARRGQTRDAETCFLKRAEGSGLGAEMALYEVARLRRDVLADAPGALAALAEYRTRFPTGSLRREADMSQLELLLQLGRTNEALKQSDELLSSSSSGERAAELHLLRGHILRKAQSRFTEAAREYELAEQAGARGGEGSYFRALCLEALGRAPEAAALFSKYLEQPQGAYVEDARRRMQRLKP